MRYCVFRILNSHFIGLDKVFKSCVGYLVAMCLGNLPILNGVSFTIWKMGANS